MARNPLTFMYEFLRGVPIEGRLGQWQNRSRPLPPLHPTSPLPKGATGSPIDPWDGGSGEHSSGFGHLCTDLGGQPRVAAGLGSVAVPPKLIRPKCANHHPKGNPG